MSDRIVESAAALIERFFEWDASLVRDGTYYAALLHAKAGGSAEDIAICIQALNVGSLRLAIPLS